MNTERQMVLGTVKYHDNTPEGDTVSRNNSIPPQEIPRSLRPKILDAIHNSGVGYISHHTSLPQHILSDVGEDIMNGVLDVLNMTFERPTPEQSTPMNTEEQMVLGIVKYEREARVGTRRDGDKGR